jgi:hypothetical protein
VILVSFPYICNKYAFLKVPLLFDLLSCVCGMLFSHGDNFNIEMIKQVGTGGK